MKSIHVDRFHHYENKYIKNVFFAYISSCNDSHLTYMNHLHCNKPSSNCRQLADLHENISCTITPGSMSLLNCEIFHCGRVSRVADTELVLLITQLNLTTRFNSWCRMSQAQSHKNYLLRVNIGNEVPISSHIWVTSTTFKRL